MATYPSLEGKVIAISGAASGMGLALARHLHHMGCKLSLTDINQDALQAALDQRTSMTDSGDTDVLTITADVRSSAEVDMWIEKTVEKFGRLDGAANFAGRYPRPLWRLECERFD
jgi:NAD(P)-dependent dehydrogenase (short-subunit alcohol dehydrogenase family)